MKYYKEKIITKNGLRRLTIIHYNYKRNGSKNYYIFLPKNTNTY